jgi:hypothetical protein
MTGFTDDSKLETSAQNHKYRETVFTTLQILRDLQMGPLCWLFMMIMMEGWEETNLSNIHEHR